MASSVYSNDGGFVAHAELQTRPRSVARYDKGLRSGLHSSLLAKMPKARSNRVKGVASRRRWKRWILILLGVLLLVPAMQVAVVPRKRLRLTRLGR
jgi:hypothetical protein